MYLYIIDTACNLYHKWIILCIQCLGYADSSRVTPTKSGVIQDAKQLYNWLRDAAGPNMPIVVYGHSLGAAVSTHAVADICREAGGSEGDQRRLPIG